MSIAIAIIDRTGILVLAETMDAASPGSSETALMKAKGSARYLAPTHRTAEFVKTLPARLAQHSLSLPDLCAFQGGVPIRVGEEVVGGLGISGVGVFKIHIHGRLISVVIEHAGNLYALFHPELVDKIQRHPNQSIACFHLAVRL